MGRNQDLRRRIAGLERVIEAHELKIRQERMKPNPDEGVMAGWKAEMEGHRKVIQKLIRRLKREW